MENKNRKCLKCGESLRSSQYAKLKREGERAVNAEDNLVCRNYPICNEAEKEILTESSEGHQRK